MTCILDAISYNQKKQFFLLNSHILYYILIITHTHIYKLSPTTFTTMKIKREPAL